MWRWSGEAQSERACFTFSLRRGSPGPFCWNKARVSAWEQLALGGALLRQYGAYPFYVDRAPRALRYYLEEFERDTGAELDFIKTGSLYFLGNKLRERFSEDLAKIKFLNGYPTAVLDATAGRIQFPDFQWLDSDIVVHESNAGVLSPTIRVTDGWIASATRMGATALTGTKRWNLSWLKTTR